MSGAVNGPVLFDTWLVGSSFKWLDNCNIWLAYHVLMHGRENGGIGDIIIIGGARGAKIITL